MRGIRCFTTASSTRIAASTSSTRPSIGVRHFIETQPFMFVGAGCGGRAAAPAGCVSRGIAVSPNCASGRAVVE
ncbi:hypothetical protein WT26_04020 [Burkholderia cepacia]|uniref:Uncharacterized protein n=2 Tax=Burkholderia cepacia complex TaxID=87882 RepID=A0A1B4PMZ5_BURCE|nr:hypothetical protein WT26_04020 [Burkholderia cepacia]AOK21982.1 hypothetical protein WK67_04020 [Burkholderia ubonensis]